MANLKVKQIIATLAIAGILMPSASSVQGESLWQGGRGSSLFTDFRARQVGDIVTVLVMETATSTQSASTDVKRSSGFDVGNATGKIISNIPRLTYAGTSNSQGQGQTNRTSNLVTRITATVTDVLPNGNLVIQGERTIQTNEEKQKIHISGVIRPMDVSSDNTVSSMNIADATIELVGDGPIGARQKEGIITRIIRFLF